MGFYSDNTPTINIAVYIKRLIFSHISGMIIKTISGRRNMIFIYYVNKPKHMVEIKLNQILAQNPHLIDASIRSVSHPRIRKYSSIPFII